MSTAIVTGVAGFIGSHVADRLLRGGTQIVGLDNLSPYYDVGVKRGRLARLSALPGFRFERLDVADRVAVERVFSEVRPAQVLHFAGQPGVRHAVDHPHDYVDANLVAFVNVLEASRRIAVQHLLYASSSSVYGAQASLPQREDDAADQPMSLYAATKRSNELMARSYAHLHGLPSTGLRLFTVYGPWGRPDMAVWRFSDAMLHGRPIEVFNGGDLRRDMTYIRDVVDDVVQLLALPAQGGTPSRVINIARGQPVALPTLIEALERALGVTSERRMLPMQPGDMMSTWADLHDLEALLGPRSRTPLAEGLAAFAAWFKAYVATVGVPAPSR